LSDFDTEHRSVGEVPASPEGVADLINLIFHS
jgi:hypothetical protein